MDLQQFILKHIESVDHLRALLLLRSEPDRGWSAMEAGGRLYLQPRQIAGVLASLKAAGLLHEGTGATFSFKPANQNLAELVEELATLDKERPVTLIKLIYSRPDTLEAFADAFRLRREE